MARKAAQQRSPSFKRNVSLLATFERTAEVPSGLTVGHLKELWIADDNSLCATASCGDEAYICELDEVPEIMAWLKEVHDKHVANKGHS